MPSLSDLDFYFTSAQKNEFRYLVDMQMEQESRPEVQQCRRT